MPYFSENVENIIVFEVKVNKILDDIFIDHSPAIFGTFFRK